MEKRRKFPDGIIEASGPSYASSETCPMTCQLLNKCSPFSPYMYFELGSVLTLTLTFGLSFAFRIHKAQVKLPGENFA